jgi:hypothetical protein
MVPLPPAPPSRVSLLAICRAGDGCPPQHDSERKPVTVMVDGKQPWIVTSKTVKTLVQVA